MMNGEGEVPILEVRGLSCVRNGKTILKNINFRIKRGEYVSLPGPNGAGKSTLLKCLTRIFPMDSRSSFLLSGEETARFSDRKLAQKMAYVPQAQTGNFPFTVRQFIEAARYSRQSPWENTRAADWKETEKALGVTNLTALAERELSTLSGGELQRVWLAGAIAQETEILLLDEVTSQMDYRIREETLALLRRLNRDLGKTVIAVTHDINEAARNADRILALKDGILYFDGKTADFLNERTLAELYGTPFLLLSSPELPHPAVFSRPGKD
ncbi:MAG: ABC transporter ATP-binding protein [Thermoguttaceae bacterium]|nr:ABC transporter ATP-binding protein [Thermoguttaceae bacterium]